MEFPAIAGFGADTSLFFLFFCGFFFMVEGCSQIYVVFWRVGNVGTSTFTFMVFEGFRSLSGAFNPQNNEKKMDLYSPQLAEHSQPSKNNKRSTCTHPPKTKKKRNLL